MTDRADCHLSDLQVDEYYNKFVGIVSEGRGMSEDDVKALADGRTYTAKQAKENGLIDEISPMKI